MMSKKKKITKTNESNPIVQKDRIEKGGVSVPSDSNADRARDFVNQNKK